MPTTRSPDGMYTHESGKRPTDSDDRAHDHLAAAAVAACAPEDIAATLRVLETITDEELLRPLYDAKTRDSSGNPITRTPEQQLAQATWADADDLSDRLRSVSYALAHAADTTSNTSLTEKGDAL